MRYLSAFCQINCVSYTLLVLFYGIVGLWVGDDDVPCSPEELLQLLLITSCVALWTTITGNRILLSLPRLLGGYAGCVAIVLGVGALTGIISPEPDLMLSVAGAAALVYAGTALYCWLGSTASAREVNASLEEHRRSGGDG